MMGKDDRSVWTQRESNSRLLIANEVFCHLTTGPVAVYSIWREEFRQFVANVGDTVTLEVDVDLKVKS